MKEMKVKNHQKLPLVYSLIYYDTSRFAGYKYDKNFELIFEPIKRDSNDNLISNKQIVVQ
jgi:hypothetical protein